jgi:NADH:ubiquinone oxidoreductase subunit
MTIGTRFHTWRFGEAVGEDGFGNRYFRDKRGAGTRDERRWVLFRGEAEASAVPPEWHAWLHHLVDRPPSPGDRTGPAWVKPHLPNRTGTEAAYRPPGHTLEGGRRAAAASGDYEPWKPA